MYVHHIFVPIENREDWCGFARILPAKLGIAVTVLAGDAWGNRPERNQILSRSINVVSNRDVPFQLLQGCIPSGLKFRDGRASSSLVALYQGR